MLFRFVVVSRWFRMGIPVVTAEGIGDYPLNLSVDRTELLRRPCLNFFHCGGVESQQEAFACFFLCHSIILADGCCDVAPSREWMTRRIGICG